MDWHVGRKLVRIRTREHKSCALPALISVLIMFTLLDADVNNEGKSCVALILLYHSPVLGQI